jgi:hypothetical protein
MNAEGHRMATPQRNSVSHADTCAFQRDVMRARSAGMLPPRSFEEDDMRTHLSNSRKRLVVVALSVPLLLIAACGQAAPSRSATADWAVYHDTRFPFQMPVPPGWRVGAVIGDSGGVDNCEYFVDVVPPGTDAPYAMPIIMRLPEMMWIRVNMKCAPFSPEDDHLVSVERLTISEAPAVLYNQGQDDHNSLTAVAVFDNHQFAFTVGSYVSAKGAQQDLEYFREMLTGFQYTHQ